MLFGSEIYLGMTYPIDGEPYEELPEHFEEVDDPAEAETILMDEETPLAGVEEPQDEQTEEPPEGEKDTTVTEEPVKRVVTMADYRNLERKVELLMKIIGGNV